jgi:hypothetical protein
MKNKKPTVKPQLVFSTMNDFSEQLMDALILAGRRGMPQSIMVFCTVTTLAKLLKMQGVSDEKITEIFSSSFNAYVNVDRHMREIFPPKGA